MQKSAIINKIGMLQINDRRCIWRLIGVPTTTCEKISKKANIINNVVNKILFSIITFNGLTLKIEKYAPRQKKSTVWGMNAFLGVISHQIATNNKNGSRTYFIK
jgi:hypothetical protein